MELNLPFDKMYVLHMAESTDRYNQFIKEAEKVGLQDKVDIWWTCRHPKVKEIAYYLANTGQYWWCGVGNGSAFNITREDYQMVKTAYLRGFEHILIMEDDIEFVDDIEMVKKVFDNIPNDYDVLRLGVTSVGNDLRFMSNQGECFSECYDKKLWGTQMFALSRKGMKYYTSYMEQRYSVADGPLYDVDSMKLSGVKNYISNYAIIKPDTGEKGLLIK